MEINFLLFLFVGLFQVFSIEACKPSTDYFPGANDESTVRAFAILKGEMNGRAIKGNINFEQKGVNGQLIITGSISGLPRMSMPMKHAFHVHQYTISDDKDETSRCVSSGGHFNPTNSEHGDISAKTRHIGDLGNLFSDINGDIKVNVVDSLSKLYGPFGIIGRTLVLHQLEDDLGLVGNEGSRASGNSGRRIACGVVGIMPNN